MYKSGHQECVMGMNLMIKKGVFYIRDITSKVPDRKTWAHEINWTKNIKALKREIFQEKKKVKETTFSPKLSHERKKTLKKPKLTGTKLETNVGKGKKFPLLWKRVPENSGGSQRDAA